MKIVIIGAGDTGYYLTQLLLKERHDIVIVEKDEKRVKYLKEHLDAQIVVGNGANALLLEPLIDETTDLLVAATDSDEVNIVATLIARRFEVKRAIVRVSDPTNLIHPLLTEDPHVSVLNAEIAVAKDVGYLVGNPAADEIEFFANGRAEMVKYDVSANNEVILRPLKDIKVPGSWLFVAVVSRGNFSIVTGDTILKPGDHVLMVGDPNKTQEIENLLGLKPLRVKRVILAGYNEISSRIAKSLQKHDIEVRLIEDDADLAEHASATLDRVLVINGDPTSDDTLEQAGIEETDYLMALTSDDENNVLISLLAKEKNVSRVITLTQKRQYNPILEKIGIDTVVNPRSSMIDEIIGTIHHKALSGLNVLEGGKGLVLEFVMKKKTKAVGAPLSKIKLPKQTLIGAIVRNNDLIVPRGDDQIQIDDQVVVFTTRESLPEVKKIFAS